MRPFVLETANQNKQYNPSSQCPLPDADHVTKENTILQSPQNRGIELIRSQSNHGIGLKSRNIGESGKTAAIQLSQDIAEKVPI